MSKQALPAFAWLICLLSSVSICVADTQTTCTLNAFTVTGPDSCSQVGTFSDGTTYGVSAGIGSSIAGGQRPYVIISDFTTLQYVAPEYHGPPPDPSLRPFAASASAAFDVSSEFSSAGTTRLGMLEFDIASRLSQGTTLDAAYAGTAPSITVTDGVHYYQSSCSGNFCPSLIGPIYLGMPLLVEVSEAQTLTFAQPPRTRIFGTEAVYAGGSFLLTEQDGTPVEAFLIPEPATLGIGCLGIALLALIRPRLHAHRLLRVA